MTNVQPLKLQDSPISGKTPLKGVHVFTRGRPRGGEHKVIAKDAVDLDILPPFQSDVIALISYDCSCLLTRGNVVEPH